VIDIALYISGWFETKFGNNPNITNYLWGFFLNTKGNMICEAAHEQRHPTTF
jgi:hypothetical protein